ncbi:MAG: GtrA family protein [Rhodospirillales bacterium]|nr:GtrA family protein [Rhodospirillales bacterium]
MSIRPESSAHKGAIALARFQIREILAGRATVGQSLRSLSRSDFGRKFCRYFLVGGASALVDWFFFSIFLYFADFHYLFAGTASFLFATAFNYVLTVRYVFDGGRFSRRKEIALVYLVSGISILINLGILSGLIESMAMHPLLAKIFGTASAFGWNFGARYFWVFKR